ncbi:MAG: hypothetical protein RR851_14700 [Clostridium sp.]
MPSNKSYNKFFIILQEDQKGYGVDSKKSPSGYAKLEMKNDKAKSSFYAQNLKKQKGPYSMILIVRGKSGNELINLGQINIDEGGSADVSNEYDVNNVANTNIGMDKVQGAAICRINADKISSVLVGFNCGQELKGWQNYPVAKDNSNKSEGAKKQEPKPQVEEKKEMKQESKPHMEEKKEMKQESKHHMEEKKEMKQESKHHMEEKKEMKQESKHHMEEKEEMKQESKPHVEEKKEVEQESKHHMEEKEEMQQESKPYMEDINQYNDIECQRDNEYNIGNEDGKYVENQVNPHVIYEFNQGESSSKTTNRGSFGDENEIFDEYEKKIEKLKDTRKKCECDEYDDEKKHKEKKHKKNDYTDKNFPVGNMGDFFKEVVKGLEKIGVNENIKNCFWYKAHVNKLEDMYCVYDYNKYSVVFYPMICYYPYISKHKNFMVGYKCNDEGQLKYIIYAIPGTKKLADQPYEGKTGFVTFMQDENNQDKGHWLMYYDIKGNTVVIPVKR